MKYSKNFDRDYNFYLKSLDVFDFCGTLNPRFTAIGDPNGKPAKECFHKIESEGKNMPCSEPDLLNRLLLTKASVNFQIKQWAEGLADGTLPLIELSKRYALRKYTYTLSAIKSILKYSKTLEWKDGEPIYHRDIQKQYSLPDWVIEAVYNQKHKHLVV